MAEQAATEALGFSPQALRAKYREERDKRLHAEGNEQYVEVTGDFSHYVDDPYIDTPLQREPLFDEVDVIVVGGGPQLVCTAFLYVPQPGCVLPSGAFRRRGPLGSRLCRAPWAAHRRVVREEDFQRGLACHAVVADAPLVALPRATTIIARLGT